MIRVASLDVLGVMDESPEESERAADQPSGVWATIVRWIDAPIRLVIRGLIVLAHLRARDPSEHPAHLLKPDPTERVRIRGWEGVLAWSPGKRVGCFTGVLIGIAIGGAILAYSLR